MNREFTIPVYSVTVKVLTCDKLSHCLFDFDCVDLIIYEKETYNLDLLELKDLHFSETDSPEMAISDGKRVNVNWESCAVAEQDKCVSEGLRIHWVQPVGTRVQ